MWSRWALMGALILLLVGGSVDPSWSGQAKIGRVDDIVDLVVLRPLGCVAIIAGTGIFVLTLPFTYPTGSVDESAERFVVTPFKYTFSRPFPDKDLE